MKNNIILVSLLVLITSSTTFGMQQQGSFESLRQAQEQARKDRQKPEAKEEGRTTPISESGSTTSTSTGSAPVIMFTEIPSETATASESAPATVVITAPALEQLEDLNTKITKLEQRIAFLQKESPIKNFDVNQDFAAGFAWLKNNRAEFISEKARTLAYETLKQLEPYKDHERELKKLDTTINEKAKELEAIETLKKTADELEALINEKAAQNPDDPSLNDMLTKAENAIQQLNTHKDYETVLKEHNALVQEHEQRADKIEEEKASLKKTFNEALQTEKKASDDFEASKRKKGQPNLQDLIQAKKNLEATKDRLEILRKKTPSPSPSSSRTPSPAPQRTTPSPSRTPQRITTPRLFTEPIDALNHAIQTGKIEQALNLIIKDPSLVNTASIISNSRTPLHIAAMFGQIEIMLELLRHGAKIDAKDAHQETPLHLAAMQGQSSAIYVLIEALRSQIKQILQDSQEEQFGDEELTMKVDQMVQEMVNAKDKYHDTPLYYAIKFNHPTAAIMLIYNGNANVNLTNINLANNRNRHLTPLDLVLRKIEELKTTSASENTIKAWTYLRDIIRQHNGMTSEELRQQTVTPPFTASPSTSSASPTPSSATRSISTSTLSMLAPISPAAVTSQSETIPVSAQILPVATMTMASQNRPVISIFGPITHHEPTLEFPLFRTGLPREGEEYKVPAPRSQHRQLQSLEEALENLTTQEAAEYKEQAVAEKKS